MNYKFKANEMTKEELFNTLNRHVGNKEMTFSCFHDDMFVYEYCIAKEEDIYIELSFYPKDGAMLLNSDSVEQLIENIDFHKFFGISTVGNVHITDLLR